MTASSPTPFALAVALCSLLLTMVVAETLWESFYPPRDREGLRLRKAYYEKILRQADLSWKEGLYYKVIETP